MLSTDADDAVDLCELVALAHFSGIPRITLADFLRRMDASYLQRRALLHPLLRGDGSGAAAEMAALAALVAVKLPRRILEFGTYDGFSTWHLWANSDETTEIVTIDLPANTKVAGSSDYGFQGIADRPFLPNDQRVRLIETDSRQWKPEIQGVDFCFIDAGHTYECVKNDSQKALLVMNPNGLIVWHDAAPQQPHFHYEVNKYLKELRSEGFDIRLVSIGPYDYSGLAVVLTE
jgi:predicted O-methyltransferase YrrM